MLRASSAEVLPLGKYSGIKSSKHRDTICSLEASNIFVSSELQSTILGGMPSNIIIPTGMDSSIERLSRADFVITRSMSLRTTAFAPKKAEERSISE
jgi:hypothetical protein